MDADGEKIKLNFQTKKNEGFARKFFFSPARVTENYVYQKDESITLFWSRELNKTNKKILSENFLSLGNAMGVSSFTAERMDEEENLGLVLTQSGMSFSRKELIDLASADMNEVSAHLAERCQVKALECAKDGKYNKIMNNLKQILKKPWQSMRGDLGLLLINEPALIYSVVKTLKLKKDLYFKVLSEKFQSLQGFAPLEI
jgi:hypothetical protein